MNIREIKKEQLSSMLPQIADTIDKRNRGAVFVCGGSMNYRGAPLLAALGALRAGAGYVVLAVPDFMAQSAAAFLPEAIIEPVKTVDSQMLSAAVSRAVAKWQSRCNAAVFGVGLGRDESMAKVEANFMAAWKKPLVIDADALFFLNSIQFPPRPNMIITPHAGEAAGLLGKAAGAICFDRAAAVRELSKITGYALLKGKNTLISDGRVIRSIMAGSPALAVPGSGDVLAGIIAAFAASRHLEVLDMLDVATAAALAHAMCGELLEEKYGRRGALAREIADNLPYVLKA